MLFFLYMNTTNVIAFILANTISINRLKVYLYIFLYFNATIVIALMSLITLQNIFTINK